MSVRMHACLWLAVHFDDDSVEKPVFGRGLIFRQPHPRLHYFTQLRGLHHKHVTRSPLHTQCFNVSRDIRLHDIILYYEVEEFRNQKVEPQEQFSAS